MELMTMDSNNQPSKMVEKYDSLIWTERYNTIGDFQITTGDVDRFMDLLPEGQVVTLRESTVPMIVERHLIERKAGQTTKLTIKGRDFCSILDRRLAVRPLPGTAEWTVNEYTPADIAYFLMDEICKGGLLATEDIFPDAQVLFNYDEYEDSTGPLRSFVIPRGRLLDVVLQFLQAEAPFDASTTPDTPEVKPHGIRAIRPGLTATANIIEIYEGTDRSGTVYFDATRDLLDDGTYLFSKEGSANAAYLLGSSADAFIEASPPKSGLERRVILVDGSQSNLTDANLLEQGKIAMSEAHETAMMDGSINADLSPYVYNVDYNLGDIVKLVGDYNLSGKARVTEYIRSEDATGIKSYPTLASIES